MSYSSTQKPLEGNRSIELIPLTSEEELELEPTEMIERNTTKPSLMMALCHTYIATFLASGFLKLISDLLSFVGPLILK